MEESNSICPWCNTPAPFWQMFVSKLQKGLSIDMVLGFSTTVTCPHCGRDSVVKSREDGYDIFIPAWLRKEYEEERDDKNEQSIANAG